MPRRLPTPPVRRLVINWALVEQRRIAAGMTHAQLAERVDAAAVTGPVRLWQDRDHDGVLLGLLERLCQVLDLHPVELFAAPTRVAQRRALPRPEVVADDQVLEAALATLAVWPMAGHPGPVSRAGVADALGWPLSRLDAAMAALDDRLADRGVRVDSDSGHDGQAVHGLRARDRLLTTVQRQALHHLRVPDQPLDIGTVRALYAIAQPDSGCTERHLDPSAAVRLQQQGLVRRRHQAGYLELTDDVRDALLLDPPDHSHFS